jgi:hypothetical protein
MQQQK